MNLTRGFKNPFFQRLTMVSPWWSPGIKRLSFVVKTAMNEGFGFLINELNLRVHLPFLHQLNKKKFEHLDTRPVRIRKLMEKLGGPYIKLGQLLSLRPDLVPYEYCQEFTKLRDDVKPLSFNVVKSIVEKELGKPLTQVFARFERKPLGSASIGQVHKAVLRKEKCTVVVKVMRPGIDRIFEEDIDAMYLISHKIDKHYKTPSFSAVQIVKEFERYTKEELDYATEANHIQRFEQAFKDSTIAKIPHVFEDHTTPRLLVMDFLGGIKLTDAIKGVGKINRREIARRVHELCVRQVFEMNIFHGDMHPGNIVILRDGRLGLFDFGICSFLYRFLFSFSCVRFR